MIRMIIKIVPSIDIIQVSRREREREKKKIRNRPDEKKSCPKKNKKKT